jgi:Protein of unknown function (DUF2384)
MSQVAKKKIAPPKTRIAKGGAFKLPQTNPMRKTTSVARTSVPVKAKDGVTLSGEEAKGLEEYLISKKLKAEVREFYPYPGLWLEAPHELLGGRTPLEIALTSPQGTEIILDLIAAIKAGHFS